MKITKELEDMLKKVNKYEYTLQSIQRIINVALEDKDEQIARNRSNNRQIAKRQGADCEVCE
jgi:hypothetical protein